MNFIYPGFLWALSFVAIPIIIHLFNFRKYKTLYYSDVSLLKNVKQQTRKQRQLKHLLVLLMRILTIIFIVFAFAQPFSSAHAGGELQQNEKVGLFIDNSLSMLTQSAKGENLNLAIISAKSIVEKYPLSTTFKLITNDLNIRHNQWMSREQTIQEIEKIVPTTKSIQKKQLKEYIELERNNEENIHFYIISDFQKSQFEGLDLQQVIWVPVPVISINQNIYIDSVWVYSPVSLVNFEQQIFASIKNIGELKVEDFPVKLSVNQKVAGITNVSIDANASEIATFSYKPDNEGWLAAALEIEGPQFTFDDIYYFGINVREKSKVAIVYSGEINKSLDRYFTDSITELNVMDIDQLNTTELLQSDLVILDHLKEIPNGLISALDQNLQGKTNLLIIPSFESDLENYNRTLSLLGTKQYVDLIEKEASITRIHDEDAYYSGAFSKKPKNTSIGNIAAHYSFASRSELSAFPLLTLSNSEVFAYKYNRSGSLIVVLASGLSEEFGGWHNHVITLPLLYQAAILKENKLQTAVRSNQKKKIILEIDELNNEVPVKVKKGDVEFIPKQNQSQQSIEIYTTEHFDELGHYEINYKDENQGIIAVNTPISESQIEFVDVNALSETTENFNVVLDAGDQTFKSKIEELIFGKKYWKQCLLLALFFLAFEVGLLKFWKTS